jgi:hypothetical protein
MQTAVHSAQARILADEELVPSSFTRSGRQVVATRADSIVAVTVENGEVHPLIETPSLRVGSPEISPDGGWLAYRSRNLVSGGPEIYVRRHPGPEKPWQVSNKGGSSPAWSHDGSELFYVSLPDAAGLRWMMAATFEQGSPPRIGIPTALFSIERGSPSFACVPTRCYDVAPGGELFYATRRVESVPPGPITQINVIEHWFEELKRKVPVR